MTESDLLLSSLCAICHINPHVYKCPRCAVLTCSLACVKRHKKWASCNGVRNPAAYVQIGDLATPAGIDKDYNYLTSLERQLDNAEKDASSRGIQIQEEILRKRNVKRGAQSLQAGLQKSRAIIIRAPKGMSREKTNTTRWLKGSQRLEWTVEWVHQDGRKEIGQCIETEPISRVYEALRSMKLGGKRKHSSMQDGVGKKGRVVEQEPTLRREDNELAKLSESAAPVNANGSAIASIASEHGPEAKTEAAELEVTTATPKSKPSLYLHAPSLPTKKTVLIPLSEDVTLQTALRERVVLEYPTIYAFGHDTGDVLPERFMLEDEYLKVAKKEGIEELEDGEIGEAPSQSYSERNAAAGRVNEKKLLEVLGRDIGMAK